LTIGAKMIELMEITPMRCFCGNCVRTSSVRLNSAIVYYCEQCGMVFHRQLPDTLVRIDDTELERFFKDSNLLVWSGT